MLNMCPHKGLATKVSFFPAFCSPHPTSSPTQICVVFMCMCVCMHACMYVCVYVCMSLLQPASYVLAHPDLSCFMCVYVCMYVCNVYMHICIYVLFAARILRPRPPRPVWFLRCVCVCVCVCMRMRISMYVCTYECLCMYACMRACMYVCMHVIWYLTVGLQQATLHMHIYMYFNRCVHTCTLIYAYIH